MIALELSRVVVDEPTHGDLYGNVTSRASEIIVGSLRGCHRAVYLPQLALVAIEWFNAPPSIVPLEHVWHMDATGGGDVLELLASVIP